MPSRSRRGSLACAPMRRLATWCTGHRKTVILSWIVALIGIGVIAGSAGSDFTEEFKLPASDSTGSLRSARRQVPGAVRGHRDDRLQGRWRGRIPGREEEDGGRLRRQSAELPHVSEVASPYESGGAAAISDDGKIAYATVQYDVTTNETRQRGHREADRRRRGGERRRPPGRGRRPAGRGSARRRRRRLLLR